MITPDEARNIANTTWEQIPIGIKMSVGARNLSYDKDGTLIFKCMIKPMRFISVRLNSLDLYHVTYFRWTWGMKEKIILKEEDGIYNDMLGEMIYQMTLEH